MNFDHVVKILGLAGAFAGFATLVWRLLDVWKAFLHIAVAVESMQGALIKIKTVVENTNSIPRKIDAAFLVVGPEDESVDNTVIRLLQDQKHADFNTTTGMVRVLTDIIRSNPEKIVLDGRAIVPLAYYYDENIDVADENLTYEKTLLTDRFPTGTYSVRFYVEAHPRLHRVVQAVFQVA